MAWSRLDMQRALERLPADQSGSPRDETQISRSQTGDCPQGLSTGTVHGDCPRSMKAAPTLPDSVLVTQEYVRGLCDPELQKVERYPVDMHCIFAGARGLFLDRLVRDTSAEVLVPEPGHLRLLGRAEPVVMAQSRVQQFVALFQVRKEKWTSQRPVCPAVPPVSLSPCPCLPVPRRSRVSPAREKRR